MDGRRGILIVHPERLWQQFGLGMNFLTNKSRGWVILALSLVTSGGLLAAPFDRTWDFKQPDGSVVQIHGRGDEFSADMEVGGYTVIFDIPTKSYVYATRTLDGRLESSGLVAGRGNPVSLNLQQHLRADALVVKAARAERFSRWDKATQNSSRWDARKTATSILLAPSPTTTNIITGPQYEPPAGETKGSKVGLCLLIDFSDVPGTIARGNIEAFCNGDNYVGYGNNGSVKKYFQDVSNNRLTYTNIVTVYLRVPKSKADYDDISRDCGDVGNELVRDAIAVLKGLPNYTAEILPQLHALTLEDGGRAVACNVFFAGGNSGVWTFGLWPHSWSLYNVEAQTLGDGISVFKYQITDMGTDLKLGTFCHENGHMLCDFPDIYDYGHDSKGGAGRFCLMNSGASGGNDGTNPVKPCGYLRMHSGWLDAKDLLTLPDYLLTLTINDTFIYKYTKPSVPTEYYLFENRQKIGRDADIPGSGIAIWHCDELGDKDKQTYAYNTTHQNYEVQLMQADNLWDLNENQNSGEPEDLYYLANPSATYMNEFSDETAPSSRWWDGSLSELFLGGFSTPGDSMTMNRVRPPPEITSQNPLPDGRVGSAYWFQFTVKDKYSSNTWSVVDSATLPPGLTLAPSGLLSGIPTVAGSNHFVIVVSNGSPTTTTNAFDLLILPAYTAPYAEGFDGVLDDARSGWRQESISNNVLWRIREGSPSGRPGFAFEGEKNAYLGCYDDQGSLSLPEHITRLISPMIQFGPQAREVRLSFAYYLENRITVLKDSFSVYYKTAWSDAWSGPIATFNATDPVWLEQSLTLPESAAGKGIYFAFEGSALGGHGISLDDIRIYDPIPPLQIITRSPLPVALCGTNYSVALPLVTLESVGGYTNSLGQTQYGYVLAGGALPTGFFLTPGGAITGKCDVVVALTSFDVEVTDLVSGAKATNTLSFAVEFPRAPVLQENFLTSNGNLPAGWTNEYVANTVSWKIGYAGGKDEISPPSSAHSDYQFAFFFGTPSAGTYMVSKLVSPVFDLTQMPNNSRLVFWHFMQKWQGQDELRVHYRNVPGAPWTRLATYTNNVTSWTQQTVQLPFPSRTYQIAFEGVARSGYGICVDTVSITDDAGAPIILTRDVLPSGFENYDYSTQLQAVGGTPPYVWAVASGSLPRGLSLNSTSGLISGIPQAATQTTFRVSVTGADNRSSTNTFSLKILEPGIIPYVEHFNETTLPEAWTQTNTSGSATWQTSVGTYSTYSPRLPSVPVSPAYNLCLWGQAIGGWPQSSTLFTKAFDLGGCTNTVLSFYLCMRKYSSNQDWLEIQYRNTENGAWTTLFSYDSNYFMTNQISVWTNQSFALPSPTAKYQLAFVGTVRGGHGICLDDVLVQGELPVSNLEITTPNPLPDGTNLVLYPPVTLVATNESALPLTWRIVTSDILPPGLTLDPTTGVISGTPTQPGIYTFGVTVEDANSMATTTDFTLRILSGALTPFETWKALYFPSLGSYLGDAADQSGDGIPNLIKYGMGLNPTNLNPGTYILGGLTNVVGVPSVTDGNYLYFVYRRSLIATDLDFFVKGKTNLADVAELWTTNNIVQQLTPYPWTVGETGVWSWVTSLHTTPITNAPQRFLRLEVQFK